MPIFKNLNDQFFKIWSPQMAYVLGYFAADGSMLKNRRGAHFIEFTSVDKDLIETVQNILSSDHKVSTRQGKSTWHTAYRLQLGSKTMYNDLLGLGFVQAKSKNLIFPEVPPKFISHFIRGYFDGDGHVSIINYKRRNRPKPLSRTIMTGFTCGSRSFLEQLHGKLKQYAMVSGGSLCYSLAYRLTFSVKDSGRINLFLYKDAENLFLNRKKKVFDSYFSSQLGPVA
jgi:intein-encoded DNA endonuclease-like protein